MHMTRFWNNLHRIHSNQTIWKPQTVQTMMAFMNFLWKWIIKSLNDYCQRFLCTIVLKNSDIFLNVQIFSILYLFPQLITTLDFQINKLNKVHVYYVQFRFTKRNIFKNSEFFVIHLTIIKKKKKIILFYLFLTASCIYIQLKVLWYK